MKRETHVDQQRMYFSYIFTAAGFVTIFGIFSMFFRKFSECSLIRLKAGDSFTAEWLISFCHLKTVPLSLCWKVHSLTSFEWISKNIITSYHLLLQPVESKEIWVGLSWAICTIALHMFLNKAFSFKFHSRLSFLPNKVVLIKTLDHFMVQT